jgi:RNA recognition motif-containing protein
MTPMVIVVSNLNKRINDTYLQKLFSAFGKVTTALMVKGHHSSMNHHMGVVVMEDEMDGRKAIRSLHKSLVMHQFILAQKGDLRRPNSKRRFSLNGDIHKPMLREH